MTFVVGNPFVSRKKVCKHQDIENNYHKKYIFEILCQGKMFFSSEHKKKLQVLQIVLDFTSSTSIKHVLAYFQGNTEIQGLVLYPHMVYTEWWRDNSCYGIYAILIPSNINSI